MTERKGIRLKLWCILLLLLLFMLHGAVMAGNTGKIAGTVADAETGEPLIGANVLVVGTNRGSASDNDGHYYILNIPPGSYSVRVTYMGYEQVTVTGVRVTIDHTTTVDYNLRMTTVEGQEVTIVAEREVIQLDVSSSQMVATAEEVKEVPLIMDVNDFIQMQAGVEGELIRGGGLDQTGLVVDGLVAVDNVNNEPLNLVNLSAIEEVSIIKGGFNAEYGNVRSGLINITTKQGARAYHGSADFRYTWPDQKHRGPSMFDPDNFFLRPYLDPDVCWVGTRWGNWDEYTQNQYPEFEGWNQLVANNPALGLTPEEARNVFIWQHRAEGSEELGHPHPGEYGDKPDVNIDASFSGPVPLIGKYLGNTTFFASWRSFWRQTVYPVGSVDYNYEQNAMVKLNTYLSSSMKLGVEAMFGREENSGAEGAYVGRGMYFRHGSSPMDIDQSIYGISFDHVLSPSTFYNVRVSRVSVKNLQDGADILRDTTPLATFGNITLDEQPWGWYNISGYQYALGDNMVLGGVGGGERNFNKVTTYNAKLDFTTQLNRVNQIKAGFEFNYDDFDVDYGFDGLDVTGNYEVKYNKQPIRFGAYVQDKLEFKGMIANIGLRLDYNEPNTEWFTVDRYSKYFSRQYKAVFEDEAPQEPAEGHVKLAPRLGISHPITANSKLYFNYGHFFSMPTSSQMFRIDYGVMSEGVASIGNPNLKMPRTIQYELGYEHEFSDMYLIRVAGYYKDVTDQAGGVRYVNYDESVNYEIEENNHYADVRGFEIEFRKTWGKWITGWLNYNYVVQTNGFVGREVYYQDPRRQAVEGYRDPYQEKPLPQPFARGYLQVRSPYKFGPKFLGMYPLEALSVGLLAQYQSGDYLTWEPKPPYKEENNLQWKDWWEFDARIQKHISIGRFEFNLFADIRNVFNIKRLNGEGFENEADYRDYMTSLHLPMYSESKYANDPLYTTGDDKVGDVRSDDKPYIDMPNANFMAWTRPRSVILGILFEF